MLELPDALTEAHLATVFGLMQGEAGEKVSFRGITGWLVHAQVGESPEAPDLIDWEFHIRPVNNTIVQRFVGTYRGRIPVPEPKRPPPTRFEREDVV